MNQLTKNVIPNILSNVYLIIFLYIKFIHYVKKKRKKWNVCKLFIDIIYLGVLYMCTNCSAGFILICWRDLLVKRLWCIDFNKITNFVHIYIFWYASQFYILCDVLLYVFYEIPSEFNPARAINLFSGILQYARALYFTFIIHVT